MTEDEELAHKMSRASIELLVNKTVVLDLQQLPELLFCRSKILLLMLYTEVFLLTYSTILETDSTSLCASRSTCSTSVMVIMYYTAVSYLPCISGSLTCFLPATVFSVKVQIIFVLLKETHLPQKHPC